MDHLFDLDLDLDLDLDFDSCSFSNPSCSPSPILSVEDIEQLLFKDEEDEAPTGEDEGVLDDILLDSPLKSGEVVEEKEKSDDDPQAKKRKRQLRNRDAAVRSRERKKMHVKDLEMKSRYYEGECRRLGSLLQWYMAENQALRFTMQATNTNTNTNTNTSANASMTKQESAVLLLESLLLGSLLWLMVVLPSLVLVTLTPHLQPQLVLVTLTPHLQPQPQKKSLVLVLAEEKHVPSLPPGKGASECESTTTTTTTTTTSTRSVGKRFKASRARMRQLVRGRLFHLFLDLLIII